MAFELSSARPQSNISWVDLAVFAGIGALIYGLVSVAQEWSGQLQTAAEIDLSAKYLPLYALYSLTRGVVAYVISFFFTMIYGYVAARVRGADRVMIPVLDILQSIPVLGFLPIILLSLIRLFPHRNFGLELASVLTIFTGQVWNMTFSFYASLKSVPENLESVSRLAKLTWWQRFLRLDLSFAAPGLLWNSMISMAGGWFFLTVSEAMKIGDYEFRVPGVGSYMYMANKKHDAVAQVLGVLAMIGIIVFLDQLVWRPLVAWSQKFSDDESGARGGTHSWVWDWIRRSQLWSLALRLANRKDRRQIHAKAAQPRSSPPIYSRRSRYLQALLKWVVIIAALAGTAFAGTEYIHLLRSLTIKDWHLLSVSTVFTFARVIAAVTLASLWTIPVGVMIGRSARWSNRLQPVIQMVASFPAPMIFPVVIGVIFALGGSLGIGSIFLLLLGTQWYVLFNVISGAGAIPRELWEVTKLQGLSKATTWKRLILPAIFPALLTGWITAMGGAWNATIVAEYTTYNDRDISTVGLGALITQAADSKNFALLGAAVGIMSLTVVLINRLVWRPLSRQAQTRFGMDA